MTLEPPGYQQLSIFCAQEMAEHLAQALIEQGALAVTLYDAGGEMLCEPALGATPLWHRIRLVGLFDADTSFDVLLDRLRIDLAPATLPPYTIEWLEGQDWAQSWQSGFEPQLFAERLWVGPSWRAPAPAGVAGLVIDPGLAFGTGAHATTALCLEWLATTDVNGFELIDYGCGSGILAVAGLKLGARHVFAVDLDPQALKATWDNAVRNGVEKGITVLPPEAMTERTADIVVANILANPLIELAPKLAQLVCSGGRLVLSGLLANQAQAIAQAYQPWLDFACPVERDGWVRLVGHRRVNNNG